MGVNKVEINNPDGTTNTIIDLTSDSVTSESMLYGTTAHSANGEQIVGSIHPIEYPDDSNGDLDCGSDGDVLVSDGDGGTRWASRPPVFPITEDIVTVTTSDTKGVSPYSTSYGMTYIEIDKDAGIDWVDGGIYTFTINTKMVVASAYRNIAIRIGGDSEGDVWHPVMGSSSSILSGSSYFTKAVTSFYQYKSTYRPEGALHITTDNNTTYGYLVNTVVGDATGSPVTIDSSGYGARYSLIFPTSPLTGDNGIVTSETYSSLVTTCSTGTTKVAVSPSSEYFYIDRSPLYLYSANVSAGAKPASNLYQNYTGMDLRYTANTSSTYVTARSKCFLWLKNFNSDTMSFESDATVGAIMSLDKVPTVFPSTVDGDVYLYFLGWNTGTWYTLNPVLTGEDRIYKYTPSSGEFKTLSDDIGDDARCGHVSTYEDFYDFRQNRDLLGAVHIILTSDNQDNVVIWQDSDGDSIENTNAPYTIIQYEFGTNTGEVIDMILTDSTGAVYSGGYNLRYCKFNFKKQSSSDSQSGSSITTLTADDIETLQSEGLADGIYNIEEVLLLSSVFGVELDNYVVSGLMQIITNENGTSVCFPILSKYVFIGKDEDGNNVLSEAMDAYTSLQNPMDDNGSIITGDEGSVLVSNGDGSTAWSNLIVSGDAFGSYTSIDIQMNESTTGTLERWSRTIAPTDGGSAPCIQTGLQFSIEDDYQYRDTTIDCGSITSSCETDIDGVQTYSGISITSAIDGDHTCGIIVERDKYGDDIEDEENSYEFLFPNHSGTFLVAPEDASDGQVLAWNEESGDVEWVDASGDGNKVIVNFEVGEYDADTGTTQITCDMFPYQINGLHMEGKIIDGVLHYKVRNAMGVEHDTYIKIPLLISNTQFVAFGVCCGSYAIEVVGFSDFVMRTYNISPNNLIELQENAIQYPKTYTEDYSSYTLNKGTDGQVLASDGDGGTKWVDASTFKVVNLIENDGNYILENGIDDFESIVDNFPNVLLNVYDSNEIYCPSMCEKDEDEYVGFAFFNKYGDASTLIWIRKDEESSINISSSLQIFVEHPDDIQHNQFLKYDMFSGDYIGVTLSNVATSGKYSDLTGAPDITVLTDDDIETLKTDGLPDGTYLCNSIDCVSELFGVPLENIDQFSLYGMIHIGTDEDGDICINNSYRDQRIIIAEDDDGNKFVDDWSSSDYKIGFLENFALRFPYTVSDSGYNERDDVSDGQMLAWDSDRDGLKWVDAPTGGGSSSVTSVNGQVGDVEITAESISALPVTEGADGDKIFGLYNTDETQGMMSGIIVIANDDTNNNCIAVGRAESDDDIYSYNTSIVTPDDVQVTSYGGDSDGNFEQFTSCGQGRIDIVSRYYPKDGDGYNETVTIDADLNGGAVICHNSDVLKFPDHSGTLATLDDIITATDVQINGTSITSNGVANIPMSNGMTAGVVMTGGDKGVTCINGQLKLSPATNALITARNTEKAITPAQLDFGVKAALTDGIGAAWTDDEKAAARERLGISDPEELSVTLNSSGDIVVSGNCVYGGGDEWVKAMEIDIDDDDTASTTSVAFGDGIYYKKILVIVDESGISGTTYSSLRFGILDASKTVINSALANTSSAWKSNCKWKTIEFESITSDLCRYTVTSETQLNGYVATPQTGQLIKTASQDLSKIGGIYYYGQFKAGTKITIYGIRTGTSLGDIATAVTNLEEVV